MRKAKRKKKNFRNEIYIGMSIVHRMNRSRVIHSFSCIWNSSPRIPNECTQIVERRECTEFIHLNIQSKWTKYLFYFDKIMKDAPGKYLHLNSEEIVIQSRMRIKYLKMTDISIHIRTGGILCPAIYRCAGTIHYLHFCADFGFPLSFTLCENKSQNLGVASF